MVMGCRGNRLFFILSLFLGLFLSPVIAAAVECGSLPTDDCTVSQNTTFTQGFYNLPNGITILASNILLDCNNSILNGTGSGNGIYNERKKNVTIKNCNVQNYGTGIYLYRFGTCTSDPSQNNHIENNTITNTNNGIYVDSYNCGPGLGNHIITSNTITSNTQQGIYIVSSNNNNISQNTIQNNSNFALNIVSGSSSNNVWHNNFINNPTQAYDSGTDNHWNTTGEGNHWSDYDSEAEGCFDTNNDIICDSPYNISGSAGSKDNYPFVVEDGWLVGLQM